LEGQVCRITIGGNSAGTGFLVGPQAVLTAGHVLRRVVEGAIRPDKVRFQFDYKVLRDGTRMDTPSVGLADDWKLDYSPPTAAEDDGQPDRETPTIEQLDYALVRLAAPIGEKAADPHPGPDAAPRRWIRIPAIPPKFSSPMPVMILQHPDGQPLHWAMDTHGIDEESGLWLNANKTRVRYATNTEPGASGSPCFDFDWNLLALHQYGDGGYGGGGEFNQGTPITAIRDRLGRSDDGRERRLAALGD
jgi:hypothetical protein